MFGKVGEGGVVRANEECEKIEKSQVQTQWYLFMHEET